MSSPIEEETPVSHKPSSSKISDGRDVPSPAKKRRSRKRPFVKGHTSKSILPAESKRQLIDSALLTTPLRLYHPIFISLRGLLCICLKLHSCLRVRDRMLQTISAADLFYPALMCSILKLLRCDALLGFVDPDLPTLEATFCDVTFPSIIADYIDSIGHYSMSNGLTIIPSLRWLIWENDALHFDTPSYVRKHFIHPGLCMPNYHFPQWYDCATADIDIPSVEPSMITAEKWCLMPGVIERYRSLIPRMMKSVDMRIPSKSCEGQSNILVCRQTVSNDTVIGRAPQCLSDDVSQIGACFGWNYFEEFCGWPGDRHILSPWTAGVMFSLSNRVAMLVQTKMRLFSN